jgi:hypothetical protein
MENQTTPIFEEVLQLFRELFALGNTIQGVAPDDKDDVIAADEVTTQLNL